MSKQLQRTGLVSLFGAVSVLLVSLEVHGATYFMSPTGNDSNAGTQSSPWKTLERLQAAQKALKSGDTVYFRGGDYLVDDSGARSYYAWSAPGVTYKNYNNETPTIVWDRTQPRPSHSWIIYVSGSNATIDGVNIRSTERSRSFAQEPDGDIIRGNRINPGGFVTWATGVTIRNCSITNFSLGVGAYGNSLLVEHCVITGSISHPIYIGGANNTFRYNELDGSRGYGNAQGIQIQYEKSKGNRIYGNLIKNGMATGIVMSGRISNNEVFNNVFVNAGHQSLDKGVGWAINFWCEDGPIGSGNKIYNNTFIGTSRYGLVSNTQCPNKDTGPLGRNVEIFDNIFYPKSPVPVGLATSNVRNNIFYNISGSLPAGNIKIDPKLANPSGTTAVSARLELGSPAINRGLTSSPISADFTGVARVGTADLGAFEFRGTLPPSRKKPSRPTGLIVR